MTNQEVFDKVLFALRKQGRASIRYTHSQNSECAYRGHDGMKCAVGHLIPDEKYNAGLEGVKCSDLQVRYAAGLTEHQEDLGIALQDAHDHCLSVSPEAWEERMRRVAVRFDLEYTEPA